jgi:hypothetical protein
MEKVRRRLSCADANKMDMVDYLATIGIAPAKIRGNDYWFTSPFREEHTPSFKVDRRNNIWYDHGEGEGGNFVDFGLLFYRCGIPELLTRLSGERGIAIPLKQIAKPSSGNDNHLAITGVKPLVSPALLQYSESRCIPPVIISKYCAEVNYTNGGKCYFGIGFKNDLGGYELRSKYFKGSSAPKGITHLKSGHSNVAIFEGFFNFLSFQTQHQNTPIPATDFLILNSLSFFEKARPIMESYQLANLYLDNNPAGQKSTAKAITMSNVYQDKSSLYKGHEDLNDFLKNPTNEIPVAPKRKRGLRH